MQNFSEANQFFANEMSTYNANELTSMKGNVLKLEVQIDKNDNLEADNMKLGDRLCRVSSYIFKTFPNLLPYKGKLGFVFSSISW